MAVADVDDDHKGELNLDLHEFLTTFSQVP